jgi:hypothetical protein
MKNSIVAFALGCISGAIISGPVHAQGTNNLATSKGKTIIFSIQDMSAYLNEADSISSEQATAVNLKAVKNFKESYGNAKNVKWFAEQEGYLADFTEDGFLDRAFYSKKGRWQGTLKFYTEHSLPADIRDMVKRTYYDFSITLIEEVSVPDHLAYLVHLEDQTHIKIVRVSEAGEMDVLDEFIKG